MQSFYVLTDPSNHRGRPWVHHPVSGGAVHAEAPQAADWRRRHGRADLITVLISVSTAIAMLHVPQDVEERVDVARQRKRARAACPYSRSASSRRRRKSGWEAYSARTTKRTRSGPTYTGKHPATAGDDRARPAVPIRFSPDLHRSRVLEIRLFLVAPLLGAAMPRTTVPHAFVCTEMHEPREDGAEVTSAFTA